MNYLQDSSKNNMLPAQPSFPKMTEAELNAQSTKKKTWCDCLKKKPKHRYTPTRYENDISVSKKAVEILVEEKKK